MGRRRLEVPVTRFRALSEAIEGNFRHLDSADGAGLADLERRGWAAGMLIKLIGEEIARLKALREDLDHETIALDRAEAPHRAMFDTSASATLLRKYEAAAERGFFRALRELREVQAETPEPPISQAEPEVTEEVGSFLPADPDPAEPPPVSEQIPRSEASPDPHFETSGPEIDAPPGLEAALR
jgi:hypothetical protein